MLAKVCHKMIKLMSIKAINKVRMALCGLLIRGFKVGVLVGRACALRSLVTRKGSELKMMRSLLPPNLGT